MRAISQPALRIAICVAVVAGIAAVYTYALQVSTTTAALTLLIAVLVGSSWGLRYAVFLSVMSTLAYDYFFLPPIGAFTFADSQTWHALVAFLIAGITVSQLSARAHKEALNAERRGTEAARSRQRFADLVNSVEGIVWEADADTFVFSFVSEQAERILGYPVARWLTDPTFWKDHLYPEDHDGALRFRHAVAAEQRSGDFAYRMIAADGRVVWLRDFTTVVSEGERATRLRGVMVMTKRAEEALREQANLLNLVHDTIFVREMDSAIKYWNRAAEELYGWTEEEVTGRVTHELLKTVFPVPLKEIEAQVVSTGRWEGELVHTRKDGTQMVVASRWSLRRDEQGVPVGFLETNNDITERKRADEALQRQANLLDQTYDAIIVWEFPGQIVYWNRGAERLYGFSREEAIGRRSHHLLRTEHPMPTATFEAFIERHGIWSGELTHTTRDGRIILVESRHQLMREADGRQLVLESNRDITERKRAEEAVRQAQADLAHMSRVTTMGELTASLAHELNQPIAAAVTDANTCYRWLTRDQPDVEEAREAATRIVKDATRAAEIIARIRSFYKKSAPQRDAVDVNEVVREMLVLLRNEANRYSVSIRTQLTADLPAVIVDRVQLQQVFMNLMLNGIEAMKDTAGELTITSQRGQDNQLLISVSDTGVGLPAENADRIFNAFFTTKPEGTGMGLAITRSILEAHGGRVWVTGGSGRGATFHFTLPSAAAAV